MDHLTNPTPSTTVAGLSTNRRLNAHASLVIIPAFNAETTLGDLLKEVREFVCESNLLVIDDGSTDHTVAVANSAGVAVHALGRNYGKGRALREGYRMALRLHYRSVLSLDADRQHQPGNIPRFFSGDDGRTILLGTRAISLKHMSVHRWLSNNWTSAMISAFSAQRVRDSQCGFRLVPTSLLRQIRLDSDGFDLESELLYKAGALGFAIRDVPVDVRQSEAGTHINSVRDTVAFIRQTWRRIWL